MSKIFLSISGNSGKRSCTATEIDFSLLPFKTCRQPLDELGQTEILTSCAGRMQQYKPASTTMACCSGKARMRSAREQTITLHNAELVDRLRTDRRKRAEKVPCCGGQHRPPARTLLGDARSCGSQVRSS